MTPERQRIAIAGSCPRIIGLSSSGAWMWKDSSDRWHCCYPENDPRSDLNAMHEALLTLDDEHAIRYRCILTQMAVDRNFDPMMASACQQAEAYLRTLNLYEE